MEVESTIESYTDPATYIEMDSPADANMLQPATHGNEPAYFCTVVNEETSDSLPLLASDIDSSIPDVDDIYQAIDNEMQSNLLSGVDLYLECDNDSVYEIPEVPEAKKVQLPPGIQTRFEISFPRPPDNAPERHHCEKCSKSFTRETLLKDHYGKVHGVKNQYPCGSCGYVAQVYRQLQKHNRRQHTAKLQAKSVPTIVNTSIAENQTKTFISNSCGTSLDANAATDVATYDHIMMHNIPAGDAVGGSTETHHREQCTTEVLLHTAQKCNKDGDHDLAEVRDQRTVAEAVETTVTLEEAIAIAPILGTAINKSGNTRKLSSYLINETDKLEKINANCGCDFCCSYCGKTFKHRNSLNLHEKTHGGELNFCCEICSKQFASKGVLHKHLLTHQVSKVKCDQDKCTMSFRSKGAKNEHVARVHGLKKFQCTKKSCKKKFALERDLKSHMQCHTSQYKCSWTKCKKKFRDQFNLDRHYKTHKCS